MLVTAAQKVKASVLWSEDLNAGQRFGAVEIRNPFV
jgi:predicted nucleic acid-binding protein